MNRRWFLKVFPLLSAVTALPVLARHKPTIASPFEPTECESESALGRSEHPNGRSRIGIVAIGDEGSAILSSLPVDLPLLTQTVAIATNPRALRSVQATREIVVSSWTAFPCDPKKLTGSAADAVSQIRETVIGLDVVLIVAGQRSAVDNAMPQLVGEVAKEAGILTVIGVTPKLLCRNFPRRQAMTFDMQVLRSRVDAIVLLASKPSAQVGRARGSHDSTTAQASERFEQLYRSVAGAVDSRGFITMDTENFRSALGNSVYVMGHGTASTGNFAELAAMKAVWSPSLRPRRLRAATNVLVAIEGMKGPPKLREIHTVVEVIRGFCQDDLMLDFSAYSNPSHSEEFRVTILSCGGDPGVDISDSA